MQSLTWLKKTKDNQDWCSKNIFAWSRLQSQSLIMRRVLHHPSALPVAFYNPFPPPASISARSTHIFSSFFFIPLWQKISLTSGRLGWGNSVPISPSCGTRRTWGTMSTHAESWPRWSRYTHTHTHAHADISVEDSKALDKIKSLFFHLYFFVFIFFSVAR